MTAQPRFEILHADADVGAQTFLGNRSDGPKSASLGADLYVLAFSVDLIWLRHDGVKCIHRELHHSGMRNPRAIVAVARFAFLVGAHFRERLLVSRRIVLHRNLRRHSAHRERLSPMTCLDAKERIRTHEVRRHRDQRAIGEQEIAFVPESS